MYDPNDPGVTPSMEDFRRIVRDCLRIESSAYERHNPEPYTTRRVNDKYRAARGQSVANQSGYVIVLDNLIPLASGRDPSLGAGTAATLRVANVIFPESFALGQWVDIFYNFGALTADDPRSGGEQVDWEVIPTGSGNGSSNLRRFKLLETKLTTNGTTLVQWLDNNENPVSGPDGQDVIYDPFLMFHGEPDNYLGTGNGFAFEGVALQRTDFGTTGLPPRWEIVDMEGYARWIEATCANSYLGGLEYQFTGVYQTNDRWDTKPPYAVGTGVFVDTTHYLVEPIAGDHALLVLLDADGDAGATGPIYLPVVVKDRTAVVQVYDTGTGAVQGSQVSATSSLFPAKYGNTASNPPIDTDMTGTCKIVDLMSRTKLDNKSFHIGRFVGLSGAGTAAVPIFAIDTALRMVTGQTTTTVNSTDPTFNISSLSSIIGNTPPSPLTVTQLFPVGYSVGAGVIAIEKTDGTWINTPGGASGTDRLVAAGTDDTAPATLIEKVYPTGVYNASTDSLVYSQEINNAGVQKVLHFLPAATNTGTNAGTGQVIISSVTGVTLTVTSSALQVQINYANYAVYGKPTLGTGAYSASVGVGVCGSGT